MLGTLLEPPPGLRFRRSDSKSKAFSLVEVTISIAIIAFAIIAIIGVLPAGMGVYSKASATSASTQILAKVVSDVRQADFSQYVYSLSPQAEASAATAFAQPGMRYFDDMGEEVIPVSSTSELNEKEKARIVYHVHQRVLTNAFIPSDKPARVGQFLATITVQIATNPANEKIPVDNLGYLQPPKGMAVRNYSFQFAKND